MKACKQRITWKKKNKIDFTNTLSSPKVVSGLHIYGKKKICGLNRKTYLNIDTLYAINELNEIALQITIN